MPALAIPVPSAPSKNIVRVAILRPAKPKRPMANVTLISISSISRHLAQIEELRQSNIHDRPRTFAAGRAPEDQKDEPAIDEPSVHEQPRPDAAVPEAETQRTRPGRGIIRASNKHRNSALRAARQMLQSTIEIRSFAILI